MSMMKRAMCAGVRSCQELFARLLRLSVNKLAKGYGRISFLKIKLHLSDSVRLSVRYMSQRHLIQSADCQTATYIFVWHQCIPYVDLKMNELNCSAASADDRPIILSARIVCLTLPHTHTAARFVCARNSCFVRYWPKYICLQSATSKPNTIKYVCVPRDQLAF